MKTIDKPGAALVEGDVIAFFGGELHRIDHFETNQGPLTDAGLYPLERFAVDGDWRMRVPDGPVPVVTARDFRVDVYGDDPCQPLAVHYFDADDQADAASVARQIVAECDGVSGDVFTHAGNIAQSLCTVEVQ